MYYRCNTGLNGLVCIEIAYKYKNTIYIAGAFLLAIRKDLLFIVLIILFTLAVLVAVFLVGYTTPLRFAIRLFGLYGFIAMSIAVIITPFLKEIMLYFKKPFLRIHHYFAAFGLTLITLHPVALAIERLNPAVFVPSIGSIESFLNNAGRPALIIIYVALVAVLLRRNITAFWRPFHALMYVALFFGIVHANLIGRDFDNLFILIALNVLFAISIGAFILKRYQTYRLKQKLKSLKKTKS